MAQYLLDTNLFIQSENFIYRDVFPSFWNELASLLQSGDAILHQTVYDELKRKKDPLYHWLKGLSVKPMPLSNNIMDSYLDICAWSKGQGYTLRAVREFQEPSRADAWLCAEAKSSGLVLVTNERRSNSINKIKIPNVCAAFGISCIDDHEFMRRFNFSF